jgi:hypothetical protein
LQTATARSWASVLPSSITKCHSVERRSIGNLLQANHVRIQQRHYLAPLAEPIPLVDHLGTEELNVGCAGWQGTEAVESLTTTLQGSQHPLT